MAIIETGLVITLEYYAKGTSPTLLKYVPEGVEDASQ
jgi:hypothetical protein